MSKQYLRVETYEGGESLELPIPDDDKAFALIYTCPHCGHAGNSLRMSIHDGAPTKHPPSFIAIEQTTGTVAHLPPQPDSPADLPQAILNIPGNNLKVGYDAQVLVAAILGNPTALQKLATAIQRQIEGHIYNRRPQP